MKTQVVILVVIAFLIGCGRSGGSDPINNQLLFSTVTGAESSSLEPGQYLNWGVYNIEIGSDGSCFIVNPNRTASGEWGYHLNAVKLLEVDPCTDCVWLSNIHVTPDGNVSVDISIKHPWSADIKYATGFDVKGIIMFPASQYFPDPELREMAELPPFDGWFNRWSSHEKGDAELMNPDGWTTIWSPDNPHPTDHDLDEGQPIYGYYPGKYSSGEDLGTINAYKRYYSNETRHMFEAGQTVTRTYIIHPPSVGPILASYAVYAHWAPPVNMPVVDPATDFGPEANSPMPYEFYITQDEPIDPDAPPEVSGLLIHWHMKLWNDDFKADWVGTESDLVLINKLCGNFTQHPNGVPDDYYFGGNSPSWDNLGYVWVNDKVPGFLPAELPYIFRLNIWHVVPGPDTLLCKEYYLFNVALEAPDGEW